MPYILLIVTTFVVDKHSNSVLESMGLILCCRGNERIVNEPTFKVIPQKKRKKKLWKDFLETFPECSLLIPVLRTTIKKISHRASLRDIVGQFLY